MKRSRDQADILACQKQFYAILASLKVDTNSQAAIQAVSHLTEITLDYAKDFHMDIMKAQ